MKNALFTKLLAIALVIAAMLTFTSCDFLDADSFMDLIPGFGSTDSRDDDDEDDEEDCEHEPVGEGVVVNLRGRYYLQYSCGECGEDVRQSVNITEYSDKWLYNESEHWHRAISEGDGKTDTPDSLNGRIHRAEVANHKFDQNGVCSDCSYKNAPSEGLEFGDNYDYTGYIVTGLGYCDDKHVNIPSEYDGKPVVAIGDNAFDTSKGEGDAGVGDRVIVGVTIPDTVTYISCTAFSDCENLVNFIVDHENEVYEAINNCLVDTNLGSIVRGSEFSIIPEDGSVTIIGSYAFANSEGLVSIKIPDAVTELGDKAFMGCEALVEVTMPENVDVGVDVFRESINVEIRVEHTLEYVSAKDATCYEAGNIEHYICYDCGYYYEDEAATVRLYEVTISPSHDFVGGVCSECGVVMNEVLIVSIDEIPDLGKFPLGTLENAIGLPATVNAYTKDGVRHELDVVWDLSSYDKSSVGTYFISGVIQTDIYHFEEGMTNVITASIEIVEFLKGTADIVFILDISGSMGDEINNVKENVVDFAAAIEAQGVSARWSAITYSDWTLSDPAEQSLIIKNGASDWYISAEEYKSAINGISLAYGGDEPETGVDGMMLANTALSTRQDARVFYILLTDAPCKVTNNYGVGSLTECSDVLAEDSVNVSVITTSSLFDHYSYLTSATGGIQSYIYGDFSQDLLDVLVPIIYGEVIA